MEDRLGFSVSLSAQTESCKNLRTPHRAINGVRVAQLLLTTLLKDNLQKFKNVLWYVTANSFSLWHVEDF